MNQLFVNNLRPKNHVSDGHANRWPSNPTYTRGPQSPLTTRLADLANEDAAIVAAFGGLRIGFASLPHGYAIYWHPRRTTTTRDSDQYIHGHPRGPFRSAKQFLPHILAICADRLQHCRCEKCGGRGGFVLPVAAPAPVAAPVVAPAGSGLPSVQPNQQGQGDGEDEETEDEETGDEDGEETEVEEGVEEEEEEEEEQAARALVQMSRSQSE